MRIENALRWQRMRWFLSLSLIRGFFPDLWLHVPANDLQEHLRNEIAPEKDLPTFGSDPRRKTYRMLTSLEDAFGVKVFGYLCTWQKVVFVQGGGDRVEEFVWDTLAYELFHRNAYFGFGEESSAALKQFHEIKDKRSADFKRRLLQISQTQLSPWDQMAINAEGASLDAVLDLVTSISSLNIFTASWHEAFTVRGSALLEELFEVALKVASEDTSGRLIFSADTLPFPSSWEFDLREIPNDIGDWPSLSLV
jgi:hypothetical protein